MRTDLDKHTAAAVAGGASAPLSALQKRSLCMLARRAYARARATGAAGNPLDDGMCKTKGFAVWRRLQQRAAVGQASLQCCCNNDYLPLQAHFLALAGAERQAREVAARHVTEPRQWARSRLQKECEAAADVLRDAWGYASGFLRKRRGLDIASCDEKALWQAIFLVRRRAAQLRRQVKGGE